MQISNFYDICATVFDESVLISYSSSKILYFVVNFWWSLLPLLSLLVEGTQLVLNIRHKHVLIHILFNSVCEGGIQWLFTLFAGGVQCNYLAVLAIDTILLWKSLLYFLGGLVAFSYCIIVSFSTLRRRHRVFRRSIFEILKFVIIVR